MSSTGVLFHFRRYVPDRGRETMSAPISGDAIKPLELTALMSTAPHRALGHTEFLRYDLQAETYTCFTHRA